jgi:hypothetical protein
MTLNKFALSQPDLIGPQSHWLLDGTDARSSSHALFPSGQTCPSSTDKIRVLSLRDLKKISGFSSDKCYRRSVTKQLQRGEFLVNEGASALGDW